MSAPKPPRTRSACNSCHRAKVKCSGEKTGCKRCLDNNLTCEYEISMVGRARSSKRARLAPPPSPPAVELFDFPPPAPATDPFLDAGALGLDFPDLGVSAPDPPADLPAPEALTLLQLVTTLESTKPAALPLDRLLHLACTSTATISLIALSPDPATPNSRTNRALVPTAMQLVLELYAKAELAAPRLGVMDADEEVRDMLVVKGLGEFGKVLRGLIGWGPCEGARTESRECGGVKWFEAMESRMKGVLELCRGRTRERELLGRCGWSTK